MCTKLNGQFEGICKSFSDYDSAREIIDEEFKKGNTILCTENGGIKKCFVRKIKDKLNNHRTEKEDKKAKLPISVLKEELRISSKEQKPSAA